MLCGIEGAAALEGATDAAGFVTTGGDVRRGSVLAMGDEERTKTVAGGALDKFCPRMKPSALPVKDSERDDAAERVVVD
jgi:hypothetical protein